MGGSQSSVSVNIALDKAVYCAGETVRGYADVHVLKDNVEVPDLTCSMSGITQTAVRYKKTTGTGKNKKTVYRTAHSSVTFLMLQAKVGTFERGQLARDAHLQVPFEFVLPIDAISSMPKFSLGLNHAMITYSVGLSMTTPGMLFGTNTTWLARVAVDVVSGAPGKAAIAPVRLEETAKVMRCCCIPAGNMSLAAASSQGSFKQGDHLSVTYEIDNQTAQVLEYAEVSVVRHISFRAGGHGKGHEKTVVAVKQAGVGPGEKFGFDEALGNAARVLVLDIPALQYFTTNTRNVTISYSLVVKAKTESSFVRDPKLHLPLLTYRLGPAAAADGGAEDDEDGDDGGGGGDDDKDDQPVIVAAHVVYAPNPDLTVHLIEASAIFVVADAE